MNKIDTICVFASASEKIDKKYYKVANELGVEIAKSHYNLVYGASDLGLMGEVSNTAKQLGSKVIGVMPELLYNKGIQPGDCTEFILTKGTNCFLTWGEGQGVSRGPARWGTVA